MTLVDVSLLIGCLFYLGIQLQAIILVFDNRSNESFECCKAIKDTIEVKTTDKNKKEVCIEIF